MQITSAMKMVSAAKLKKAQDAITAMRPYSNKLTQMLVNLSSSIDFENIYLNSRKVENLLVVCITSNRGLCGAFNSNIIKKCLAQAKRRAPRRRATARNTTPRKNAPHHAPAFRVAWCGVVWCAALCCAVVWCVVCCAVLWWGGVRCGEG